MLLLIFFWTNPFTAQTFIHKLSYCKNVKIVKADPNKHKKITDGLGLDLFTKMAKWLQEFKLKVVEYYLLGHAHSVRGQIFNVHRLDM